MTITSPSARELKHKTPVYGKMGNMAPLTEKFTKKQLTIFNFQISDFTDLQNYNFIIIISARTQHTECVGHGTWERGSNGGEAKDCRTVVCWSNGPQRGWFFSVCLTRFKV